MTAAYRIQLVRESRKEYPDAIFCGSEEVARLAYTYCRGTDRELITVYAVDTQNRVVGLHTAFMGTTDSCMLWTKEVFKFAILANAVSLILCHNHPSGVVLPSQADIQMTKSLLRAAESLQIPLLDHIIIGNLETQIENRFFSFSGQHRELWDQAKQDNRNFMADICSR
jgi:DNA repair protein RadC